MWGETHCHIFRNAAKYGAFPGLGRAERARQETSNFINIVGLAIDFFGEAEGESSMSDEIAPLTRRAFLGGSTAAIAAAAGSKVANAQETDASKERLEEQTVPRSPDHHFPNEVNPGPKNSALEAENPSSVWGVATDHGTVPPFKYPFALARKRIESGGWTRQVTIRELPISKTMAGVEMRLTAGGVRELHWHVSAEWALMLYGNARITAVDQNGSSFVKDVTEGDLWLFPGGIPHSIQGLGPDGCKFLLVFDDGNFNEFETFLITDWLAHTPKDILAKNFNVPESTFNNVPKTELFIFQTGLPRPLPEEQEQAGIGAAAVSQRFDFRPSSMKPAKMTSGGEVRIIDSKVFPVTPISAAIVRLKPGGLRELHWHPNADEWQYYVSGKGRMTVFLSGTRARTMDFQEGDVGYIDQSVPHYIENTGDTDLVFLEMFKSPQYEDISLAQWMAHTPARLVNQHLEVGEDMLRAIPKEKVVIRPV
jgi:oxalate decarboxylase